MTCQTAGSTSWWRRNFAVTVCVEVVEDFFYKAERRMMEVTAVGNRVDGGGGT
jgi:hypothetical protein